MTRRTLLDRHDALLLDLDGVLYRGTDPVPHAAEAMRAAADRGVRRRFVTNNASRTPEQVAAVLREVGVDAEPDEVTTSAQAAAELLAERLDHGTPVLVVGGEGLRAAIVAVGLAPVDRDHAVEAGAVVQGYGPDVSWRDLAAAVTVARAGHLWIATNTDRTIPAPSGRLPGNGTLVAAVGAALGRDPDAVAGKPEPLLLRVAAERVGAAAGLVVGDRLDTDVAGATAAGLPALLVLTGVSSPAEVAAAVGGERPRHVAADMRGLFDPAAEVPLEPEHASRRAADGWTAERTPDGVRLQGSGDPVAGLRLVAALAWAAADEAGDAAPVPVEVPPELVPWWRGHGGADRADGRTR